MTPELFLREFGELAEAPGGIATLKQLVLTLAVTGRLGTTIATERSSNPSGGVASERYPANWFSSTLEGVGDWAIGSGFPKNIQGETGQPILFCKVSDMNLPGNEVYIRATVHTVDDATAKKVRARVHRPGAIIFPKIGGAIATNKRRILARPTAIDNNCLGIHPHDLCSTEFLYLVLRAIDFTKFQVGTSVPALSQGIIGEIPIGIPPTAEQKRIVEKVDQLVALCDELEAKQKKKRETAVLVNKSSLIAVVSAPSSSALKDAWKRLADHFEVLYDLPENVKELRQTILQLAVTGKLARQDPADEPAAVWLSRACDVNSAALREIPELPNWSLAAVSSVFEVGTGSTPTKTNSAYWSDGKIPWVSSAATNDPDIERASAFVTAKAVKDFRLKTFPVGSLVIALYGQGKTRGQVSRLRIATCVNQACAVIRVPETDPLLMQYVWLCFRKQYEELRALAAGGAQPNLNVGIIKETKLPFPPRSEMEIIVQRVRELSDLCDDLELKLQNTASDSERLMQAVVERLVA